MSETALLNLVAQRRIRLFDRGHAFTITCRRVEPADWLSFFASIRVTSQQDGGQRINASDTVSPCIALAEAVIVAAEGYSVEGGVDITTLPNWVSRLPLSHRHKVGVTLSNVTPSAPSGDIIIRAEGEEVSIDCDWSLDDSTGKMIRFEGLKHIFRTPTQAQQKRYYAASSRSIVVGGSRTGMTIFAGAQELLCELYDELILRVEGYVIGSGEYIEPLSTEMQIRHTMDLNHKFVAAEQLFNPAPVSTEAPAAE